MVEACARELELVASCTEHVDDFTIAARRADRAFFAHAFFAARSFVAESVCRVC
jgi:hypothetical protein